jgi:hypothetical protein
MNWTEKEIPCFHGIGKHSDKDLDLKKFLVS